MTRLETLPKPLDRIASEGLHIGDLDDLEAKGCAISLNSKRDFMQANTVTYLTLEGHCIIVSSKSGGARRIHFLVFKKV